MINAAGRDIPDALLAQYGKEGFKGSYARDGQSYRRAAPTVRSVTDPARSKRVASIRKGSMGEGGDGVTIATFKR